MRNLKKVLALVLALVMVFGVMSIASATSFTDDADIENGEAAEVLAALKIVEGYEDGSFGPGKNITRAEMAAIVARVMLGRKLADTLKGSTTEFSDVPSTHWASGYVAYCSSEGIINGLGDGTFDPSGNVTLGAAAKMLLLAAGIEGEYTGANWLVNVTTAAVKAGILDADVDVRADATRDEIVGAAFNAMQIGTPKTETVTEYICVDAGNNVVICADMAEVAAVVAAGGKYVGPQTETITTIEDSLLDDQGVTVAESADDFGRPATLYIKGGKPIAVIAAEPTLTYTTEVTGGKLYTDLGKPKDVNAIWLEEGMINFAANDFIVSGATATVGYAGSTTEVFYDAAAKTATIVTIDEYLAEIVAFTAAKKDANGDVTVPAFVTVEDQWGDTYDFVTDEFTKDDIGALVLVTEAWDDDASDWYVVTMAAVEPTEGVATRINSNGTFVAGGKTYTYSDYAVGGVMPADVANKTELLIFENTNGYVLLAMPKTGAVAAKEYALVLDYGSEKSGAMNSAPTTFYAQLLYADAKIEIVEVDADASGLVGKMVSYAVNAKGQTVLTYEDSVTSSAVTIKKNQVNLGFAKANAATKFVVETTDASGNPVFTAYVGVNKLPTLTANAYVFGDEATDGYADVVFLLSGEIKPDETTSNDVVFILGPIGSSTVDAELGEFWTYLAIVNGEPGTLDATVDTLGGSFYSAIVKNDKGLVTNGTPMASPGPAFYGTGVSKLAAGVITVDGDDLMISDTSKAFILGDAGFEAIEFAAIAEDLSADVAYIVAADGTLATLVIY